MSKEVVLVKGRTYRYQGNKFDKEVPQTVGSDLATYLLGTGHFEETGKEKVRVTKPEKKRNKIVINRNSKKEEPKEEDSKEEDVLPKFRSKKDLAEYAFNEYNYKYEGELSDLKKTDMEDELRTYVQSLKEKNTVVEV